MPPVAQRCLAQRPEKRISIQMFRSVRLPPAAVGPPNPVSDPLFGAPSRRGDDLPGRRRGEADAAEGPVEYPHRHRGAGRRPPAGGSRPRPHQGPGAGEAPHHGPPEPGRRGGQVPEGGRRGQGSRGPRKLLTPVRPRCSGPLQGGRRDGQLGREQRVGWQGTAVRQWAARRTPR